MQTATKQLLRTLAAMTLVASPAAYAQAHYAPTHVGAPAGTITAIVTAYSDTGCSVSATTQFDVKFVTNARAVGKP